MTNGPKRSLPENLIQRGMTIEDKFLRNIYPEPNTGCWLWGGYDNGKGYGQIFMKSKSILAHRYSFQHFNSVVIRSSDLVCHKCNVPCCCNPDHLYLGTQSQNITQAYLQGRFGHHLPKPKKVGQYSISDGQLLNTYPSVMEASRSTGVHYVNISSACLGKTKTAKGFIWKFHL